VFLMAKEKEDQMEKFFEFVDRLRGRRDVKTRVQVIANPDNPKSMSVLSHGQAEFVADSYFLSGVKEWGGLFDGFKDLAVEIMEVSPSIRGLGREQTIRFVGALSATKILSKLGVSVGGEEKEGAGKK